MRILVLASMAWNEEIASVWVIDGARRSVLQAAHMLRVVADAKFRGAGRLTSLVRAVRLGGRIMCFVVVDHIPTQCANSTG
jgi:hypothetical protein